MAQHALESHFLNGCLSPSVCLIEIFPGRCRLVTRLPPCAPTFPACAVYSRRENRNVKCVQIVFKFSPYMGSDCRLSGIHILGRAWRPHPPTRQKFRVDQKKKPTKMKHGERRCTQKRCDPLEAGPQNEMKKKKTATFFNFLSVQQCKPRRG